MPMNLLDAWFKLDIGETAFYAAFGFLFVFAGILLLIVFFTVLGLIMKKVNERKQRKQETKKADVPETPAAIEIEEGISPEIVAAITAALAVYTEVEQQKCDFVVRKIRRV